MIRQHTISIGERTIVFRHPTNDEQLALLSTFDAAGGAGERTRLCMELIEEAEGFNADVEPMTVHLHCVQLVNRLLEGSDPN